jgi:hypothetical protein
MTWKSGAVYAALHINILKHTKSYLGNVLDMVMWYDNEHKECVQNFETETPWIRPLLSIQNMIL